MTSNNLNTAELYQVLADGTRQRVKLERRLEAIIAKLLAIGSEVEDPHTGSVTVHIGMERGDRVRVKAVIEKQF